MRLGVLETPPLSIVRLAVNTSQLPLDQREVRQALAYALDRGRIAEILTKAPPVVGSPGIIPPETPWFNPNLPA
jgi:peptide/nickel transport system substrate-binding protein